MDEGFIAEVIAEELNKAPWKAVGLDIGEINFTNEDGEKFLLVITKVDAFEGEDEE